MSINLGSSTQQLNYHISHSRFKLLSQQNSHPHII